MKTQHDTKNVRGSGKAELSDLRHVLLARNRMESKMRLEELDTDIVSLNADEPSDKREHGGLLEIV
jgi:hypothetical protein